MKGMIVGVMTLCWMLMPECGYSEWHDVSGHLLYVFSHANVWHLMCNLLCLMMIRGRMYAWESYCIAVVCSWLPLLPGVFWNEGGMTMGMSGWLFAAVGMKWGVYWRHEEERCPYDPLYGKRQPLKEFCIKVLPVAVMGAFVPKMNWSLHLYCVVAGLVVGRFRDRTNRTNRTNKANRANVRMREIAG